MLSAENYAALAERGFWQWALNSLVVATATARRHGPHGRGRRLRLLPVPLHRAAQLGLTALLLIQMFPQMLAFVAIFLLLLSISDVFPVLGLNSQVGLIAVYLGGALGVNTFLMYGFFNTVPKELDEAAKLDGATHAQIFFTIILRLVAPILAVVGPAVLHHVLRRVPHRPDRAADRADRFTLAVGLYQWASDERNAPWGLFAAGAVVAAVPIVVLFLFLQRYIVSGLTAGSVKG